MRTIDPDLGSNHLKIVSFGKKTADDKSTKITNNAKS